MPPLPAGNALRSLADNYVWNNSVDALSAGAGNPRVRAGVLTINAKTGMPVRSVQPARGNVRGSADTYRVLRPTLADIEAGRF